MNVCGHVYACVCACLKMCVFMCVQSGEWGAPICGGACVFLCVHESDHTCVPCTCVHTCVSIYIYIYMDVGVLLCLGVCA